MPDPGIKFSNRQMHQFADIWQPLAGLALFILGMQYMENSLNRLSGRSFKLFLKKYSSHKLSSIGGGTVITAILQSSSVVNLLVLAFVGAGVLRLQQALSIILGANLGTTLNSWIIAALGFSYNLEKLGFPLTAIGGLIMVLSSREKKIFTYSRLLLSLGFIFIGLEYIKFGTIGLVRTWDLSALQEYPLIIFVLAGLLITSIIQSSSATTAIVMSALFAGAIPLKAGMAIVLGSETGTAIKLLIASAGGLSSKRRVAVGSLLFNIIPAIILFPFLGQIHEMIVNGAGITNQLLAIAWFQTFYNLFSILLFLPMLSWLSNYLDSCFTQTPGQALFLSGQAIADPEVGMEAFKKETLYMLYDSIDLMMCIISNKTDWMEKEKLHPGYRDGTTLKKYEFIKQMHGRMRDYFIRLQTASEKLEISNALERMMTSARNAMYAAKSMKDILHDIQMLSASSSNIKYGMYTEGLERTRQLCSKLDALLSGSEKPDFETMHAVYRSVTEEYSETLREIYKEGWGTHLNDTEISTLINFNRELSTAHKSIFIAVKDYLMDSRSSSELDNMPGFIK